tara:strand:+ start:255 stop:446 length:192 start_codon:yes stop_codon:yes gene_type:complete
MILELRTSKDPKLNRIQLMQIPLKVIKQNAKHLKFQRKHKTKRLKRKTHHQLLHNNITIAHGC